MYQSGSDFLRPRSSRTPTGSAKHRHRCADSARDVDADRSCTTMRGDPRQRPSFSETQARRSSSVYDGGGLILAPGDQWSRAMSQPIHLLPGLQPATPESESGSTKLT